NLTGSVDPMQALVATQDTMAAFRSGTKRILHERWGATAGNRIAITIPAALYTGRNQGDREGLATEELPFEATGRDAGAFICVWLRRCRVSDVSCHQGDRDAADIGEGAVAVHTGSIP